MASLSGILLQEKVNRLISRSHGKPVLKPNKPLVLEDRVANRKLTKGEATCLTEMSDLMVCWKRNNFVDELCPAETKSFYACVDKARTAMTSKKEQSGPQAGRLDSKQVTTLLKRFPNLRSEI